MNAPLPGQGSWSKVERVTSLCLQIVLLSFIGGRLIFAVWWPMHTLDFTISAIAVALLIASFRFAAHRRGGRIGVIAYASATQIVPMVVREPVLLLPLLGGLIPVAILLGCLIALSRKGSNARSAQRS